MNTTPLLTVQEASRVLHCSPKYIYDLFKQGKIEFVRIGKRTRVTQRSLNALIDQQLMRNEDDLLPLRSARIISDGKE